MNKVIVVIGVSFLLLGAGVVLGSKTQVQPQAAGAWSDNFDSYETDSALHGQGGWLGWDNNAAATGYLRDEQAISSPNALEIKWNEGVASDMVQTYTDINTGVWIYTAYQYVPSDMVGMQDFILMNTYEPGGVHNNQDWSLVLEFTNSEIHDFSDVGASLPVLTDQWVQIRVEIDLDADMQTVYYGGQQLEQCGWKDHVQPGGQQNLACVDLFAGATETTSVYYDDISLQPPSVITCEAGGPYEGTVGIPIQFTGSATGGTEPYSWVWQFGDGTTSTEQNPTHAYASVGSFTAILTVTDASSNTGTDTASVTVTGPVIEITKIAGGMGVSATIKNTGTVDAVDVAWTIACDGGILLKGKTLSGTIDTLAAGAEATVKSTVIGFGKIAITVTAGDAEGTASGFVLLFFVLGVK